MEQQEGECFAIRIDPETAARFTAEVDVPEQSGLVLGKARVWVGLGGFLAEMPRNAIVSARRTDEVPPYDQQGIYPSEGDSWWVVPSFEGVVALEVDPPGEATRGVQISPVRRLMVSLEEPERFIREVRT